MACASHIYVLGLASLGYGGGYLPATPETLGLDTFSYFQGNSFHVYSIGLNTDAV